MQLCTLQFATLCSKVIKLSAHPPGGSGGPPGGGGGPMGPSPAETNAKMIKAFCQETGHYWTYALEKYAGQ